MGKSNYKDDPIYRIAEFGMEVTGKFYSRYRAFVIDNQDPMELNRLMLIVPTINTNISDGIWAFPAGSWGGNNYGVQMLPQKGDMVWVEYEMGNVEHPIWSHAGYGEDEKPPEFETPNHYGFKTPLGSIILINDNEDEEEILVKLSTSKEWINIKKDKVELESSEIKLGEKGDDFGVLGNILKDKLEQLSKQVENLTDIMSNHTHAGPAGPPIRKVEITNIANSINQITQTYGEFISEKVKIDK